MIYTVGNGVRTSEAVAASLWAFLRYGDRPEECLVRAVNFVRDTDTIGAMVVPNLAACMAQSGLPADGTIIENRRHGRDHMVGLARDLARLEIRG